jgi:hypothetical protein
MGRMRKMRITMKIIVMMVVMTIVISNHLSSGQSFASKVQRAIKLPN